MKKVDLIMKIAIPIAFFVIASIGKPSDQILKLDAANAVAGVMAVCVVAWYAFQWFTKEK